MKSQKKSKRIAKYLLMIGLFGILILPPLVTQTSLLNFFNIDFGKSNEIGDMIGGIASPFISLVSAALVYLALKEQIEANSIINIQFLKQEKSRIENELLLEFEKNLFELKSDLNSVSITDNHKMPPNNKLIGEHAIKETISKTVFGELEYYYNDEIVNICDLLDRFLEFSFSSRHEITDYYRFSIFYTKISNFIEKYFPLKSENEDISYVFVLNTKKNKRYYKKLVSLYDFYKAIYLKICILHQIEIEKNEGNNKNETPLILKDFTFYDSNFRFRFDVYFPD